MLAVLIVALFSQVAIYLPGSSLALISWPRFLGAVGYGLADALVLYLVLVLISTALMKKWGGSESYSPNAKAFGFWMAWLLALTTVVRILVQFNDRLYTISLLVILLWFFVLAAVALSVSGHVPVRRTWLPAFCSLVIAGLVGFALAIAALAFDWFLSVA